MRNQATVARSMNDLPAVRHREEAIAVSPAATDWLRNTLTITGKKEELHRFRQAAAGAGVIPWRLDLDRMEEDWFLPLASPEEGTRAISLPGARLLARRLREAAAANHARAMERMAQGDTRCVFDLQRLLPVPPAVLAMGPDDPQSRDWLWRHWGTAQPLRHVRALPAKSYGRQKQNDRMAVEFWSADWSPWQALRRLRALWPLLGFELTVDYADGI